MTTINIGKIGQTREVDFNALPEASRNFIIGYGLQQVLNDCHASVQRKDFESDDAWHKAVAERVDTKLAALAEGKITIRTGGTREPVDPVQKIVHQQAKAIITAAIKAKGVKVKDLGEGVFDKLLADYIDANREALEREAKAQIKKAAAIEVNLADLGL